MSEDLEHKFLGAGIGRWGNDTWSTEIELGDLNSEGRALVSVGTAFAFLLLAGLLILSFSILLLRKSKKNALRPMPLIATLAAMFSMVV